jgi:hypothetical protein
MTSTWIQSAPAAIDGANLLGETPEIRRQDRGRDDDRPARRGHAASRRKTNFRTALAKPSFSLLSVTRSPAP